MTEALGARAATVDEEVFIPDVAGALTIGPGAALLAHELVHVAQQRRLGSTLADGAVAPLELEARRVERRLAAAPHDLGAPTGTRPTGWLAPLSDPFADLPPIAIGRPRRPSPAHTSGVAA